MNREKVFDLMSFLVTPGHQWAAHLGQLRTYFIVTHIDVCWSSVTSSGEVTITAAKEDVRYKLAKG